MAARGIAGRGLSMALLAVAFLVMLPLPPNLAHDSLDASWVQALHVATQERLAFGSDIVFTYGPLGFVHARIYWPGLFWVTLAFWALLAVAILDAWRTVTRAHAGAMLAATTMLVVAASLAGLYSYDALVFGYLVLWPWQVVAGGHGRARLAAHGGLVGLLALSKLTFGLAGGLVAVLCAAILIVRGLASRAVIAPAAALAVFLAGWLALGQPFAALPGYVVNGMQIVLGYGEAMALRGPRWEMTAYGLLVLSLVGAAAWHAIARRDAGALAATIATLALAALAWKQGFIRQDEHVFVAYAFMALACSALAAFMWTASRVRAALLGVASVIAAGCTFASMAARPPSDPLRAARHLVERPLWILSALPGLWDGRFEIAHRDSLARIREGTPLPRMSGSTDIYSHGQAVVFAHGLRWQPRPVFQSYSAYTPALAEMNRRHLAGARAPDHLLIAIEPIDKRLPALEDGASWLPMLERYALREEGRYLVLDRAREARPAARRALAPVEGTGWIELPAQGALQLASIRLLDKPRGPAHLFRGPQHFEMQVRLEGDPVARGFRFVRGAAEIPFVLSPLVEDNHDFAQLFVPCKGDGRRVTAVRILGDRGREVPFRISVEAVDSIPGFPDAPGAATRRLACDLRPAQGHRPAGPALIFDRDGRGLNVHPPSSWRIIRPVRGVEVCTRLAGRALQAGGSDGYVMQLRRGESVVAQRDVAPGDVAGGRESCIAARFAAPVSDVEFHVGTGPTESWDWVYVTRMTVDE